MYSKARENDTKGNPLDNDIVEILNQNGGFSRPDQWVVYAKEHHFQRVPSRKLHKCPDCHSNNRQKLGQFIYYSNLVCLHYCGKCDLIYADTRIQNSTIEKHFAGTYKDEHYFRELRRHVFEQITDQVKELAPVGGDVLDVGGAKGHLLAMIGEHRPDLRMTLNDLSRQACLWASSHYHLKAICGRFADCEFEQRFDVITMIDVVYYEPELGILWERAASLIKSGGHLILRVPNMISLIRLHLKVFSIFNRSKLDLQANIKFVNPEHIYFFSRKYLKQRLANLGFEDVAFLPSTLLIKRPWTQWFFVLYYKTAKLVHLLSLGHFVITPSMLVVAKRRIK